MMLSSVDSNSGTCVSCPVNIEAHQDASDVVNSQGLRHEEMGGSEGEHLLPFIDLPSIHGRSIDS